MTSSHHIVEVAASSSTKDVMGAIMGSATVPKQSPSSNRWFLLAFAFVISFGVVVSFREEIYTIGKDVSKHPILSGEETLQIQKYLGSNWLFGAGKGIKKVDPSSLRDNTTASSAVAPPATTTTTPASSAGPSTNLSSSKKGAAPNEGPAATTAERGSVPAATATNPSSSAAAKAGGEAASKGRARGAGPKTPAVDGKAGGAVVAQEGAPRVKPVAFAGAKPAVMEAAKPA